MLYVIVYYCDRQSSPFCSRAFGPIRVSEKYSFLPDCKAYRRVDALLKPQEGGRCWDLLPCRLVKFTLPPARPPARPRAGLDTGRFPVFPNGHSVHRALSHPLLQVRDEAPHYVPGGQWLYCSERAERAMVVLYQLLPYAVTLLMFPTLDSVSLVHAPARLK